MSECMCNSCKYNDGEDIICTSCDVEYSRWKPKEEPIVDKEMVSHPLHYNQGKFEVIDVIYDWQLNFALGSALKYIARCDSKDKPIEDLKKAIEYLEFEIQEREKINEIR